MNVQFRPEPSASVGVKTAIADCDIHPARAANDELYPFMAKRWHEHLVAYGKQAYHGMMEGPPYPKAQPNASRRDAWPPEGGPQGSSLSFMQKQLLDPYNVALGVLNPKILGRTDEPLGYVVANSARERVVPRRADFVVRTHNHAADLRVRILAAGRNYFADVEIVLVPPRNGAHDFQQL